jgi:indoleamine 2,3-dioxygenase
LDSTKEVADVLESMGFSVSAERGFLPEHDPLRRLDGYPQWEAIASQLSDLINARQLRFAVDALPLLGADDLASADEWERAMLILSCLGHAYLRERDDGCARIPEQIARPWIQVAAYLGRPPVLSHASVVLRNWRRIQPDGPIALGNLAPLLQFHGGLDEAWFYLVTVEIEAIGAKAVFALVGAALAAEAEDWIGLGAHLSRVAEVIDEMSGCLLRVQERCDPYIFYQRVRPFLSSLEGVTYEGVDSPPQSHHGGSAAQSSLLQTFDRALGIGHPADPSKAYMKDMIGFMPKGHRAFVEWMGKRSVATVCASRPDLQMNWSLCVEALARFRQHHLEIVAHYIVAQDRGEDGERGTGGTNPMVFLKQMRRDTST